MKDKLVSTIIVTYNSSKWIENCLNSLINQQTRFKQQIIIVDNGSKDETINIIKEKFLSYVTLILSTNLGFGAGNNLGVQKAQGEYLFFVNPDTISQPNCLDNIITPLLKEDIVTTPKITILNDEEKINTCGNLIHFTGFGFVNLFKNPSTAFTKNFKVPAISGAAFAMRKATFNRLGGFDKDFFLYMEDSELSWRICKDNVDIHCIATTSVAHEYELKLSAQKIMFLEQGRLMIIRKHYTKWQQILILPSLLIALLFSLFMSIRFGVCGFKYWCKAIIKGTFCKLSSKSINYKHNINSEIPFFMFSSNILVLFVGRILNILFKLNFLIMKFFSNG